MRVQLFVGLVALAVLVAAGGATRGADADHKITGYPDSIAGLGDSITRAVNSDALGDRPENSWVTGTNASVDTVYSRLLVLHPAIAGNRFNEAVSGARMTDLNSQAQDAVADGAEFVTVFMGANDVCTSSEFSMTPVATFQAQFETAMATLASGLPDARIAVVSIPDIQNLWAIHKDNASARFVWSLANICQSMLANPLSNDPADVQRRADVRQRNMDFNDVLNSVCANYVHCKFDGYLGFNTAFTPAHVSTIDYFHPSVAGQALIAQLAWDAVLPDFCASGPWGAAVGDGDCDGTVTGDINSGELFIGTDPNDACADTATWYDERGPAFGEPLSPWPYDINDDGKATLSDVLAFSPAFNKIKPDPAYDPRFDLNTDERVTLSDVLSYAPYFNKFCYDFFDRLP